MSNNGREQERRQQPAENETVSINAMPYAQKVAVEYSNLETGYRNRLYELIGKSLIAYKKFRMDADGYQELLQQKTIAGLREKPDVNDTSRLVLYYLTGANNELERNTAGKYARIVDHLYEMGVGNTAAAAHVRDAGGIDATLKKVRGHEAPKLSKNGEGDTLRDDEVNLKRGEEYDENHAGKAVSELSKEKLFDPNTDLSVRLKDEVLKRVLGADILMLEVF